ncbi:MAG: hypothetical protein ISP56_06550 [Flavobacteriaceae bacterium]|nr:hypothetical protein [Flavobacteriaceae bacterium]
MTDYNLKDIPFAIIGSSKPVEDPEGLINILDAQGNPIDVPASATTFIEVLDAISEGPIEGPVEGTYTFEGTEGLRGFNKAIYKEFPDAPNLSDTKWLRSVYWNEVPIVNSNNQYNFQQVDMTHVIGTADGAYDSTTKKVLGLDNPELRISKQINDRLYGSKEDRVTSDNVTDEDKDFTRIYRIHNIHAKGCIINIRANQLFRNISTTDDPDYPAGSVVKAKVSYKIYYKPFFSDQRKNPTTYTFGAEDSMEGKITEGIVKPTRINFYAANLEDPDFRGWEIAIIRLTPESLTVNVRNATFVDSITEIYEEVYTYPHTAIVRSKFSAEFFSQIPTRAFHIKGLKVKVPNNYNTLLRTYGQFAGGVKDGANWDVGIGGEQTAANGGDVLVNGTTSTWNGSFKPTKEYTNNPAWVFYDLMTNPIYGLGKHITGVNLNKFTLYEIAQYCDDLVMSEYGELEPRFTCNLVLTTREEAIKVLEDLASVFRGLLFYKNGMILPTYDRPLVGNRVMTFNNANVEGGEFSYQSSAKNTRSSVTLVRFNDKKDFYKPALEVVEVPEAIKRYGIKEKEIAAFGCTSRGQARRLGLWSIYTDMYDTESISFTTGLDGAFIQPSDIIAIADKYKKLGRTTGRTLGIYGGTILKDSMSGFDLTQNGTVTATNNTSGKIGGCISLTTTGNLSLAGVGIHDPYSTPFSISTWFKYTTGGGTIQTICGKRVVSNGEGWELYVNTSTNRVIFEVEDGSTNTASVTASTYGDVNADTWYFAVATIDRVNNNITIQIDASHIDTASISSVGTIAHTTAFKVGDNAGGTQQFKGNIDQTCIWSGNAIGSGDAVVMYNGGSGVSIPQMGYQSKHITSVYEFQDGPTVVLDDSITSINNGDDYLLSLVTPSFNYYHDVTDLDSDDFGSIQRSQVQNISFAGSEHQIRKNKSHLFLENSFLTTGYHVTGNLVYSIEKENYTTGDVAYYTNPTGDYYRVLNVGSKDNGTKFTISAIEYSPEKYTRIDEKVTQERQTSVTDVDPIVPEFGIITIEDTNVSNPTPNPVDPPVEDTGDFVNPFDTDPNPIPPAPSD